MSNIEFFNAYYEGRNGALNEILGVLTRELDNNNADPSLSEEAIEVLQYMSDVVRNLLNMNQYVNKE
jgi:hypothetical protein